MQRPQLPLSKVLQVYGVPTSVNNNSSYLDTNKSAVYFKDNNNVLLFQLKLGEINKKKFIQYDTLLAKICLHVGVYYVLYSK